MRESGNKKGVQKGYPLIIQATVMKYEEMAVWFWDVLGLCVMLV